MSEEDAVVAEVAEVEETAEVETETEETTEATTSEETEATEKEDPKPSESSTEKPSGKDKRIDAITKSFRETERDLKYWKNIAQQQQVAPAPVEPGKTLGDFDYDEGKFATYLTDQATANAKAESDKAISNERSARVDADFRSNESDFASTVDDYYAVAHKDMPINQYMGEVIKVAPDGPALAYYFGKNDGEVRRLASLPPLEMAMEIGIIRATKLVKPKVPKPTTLSKVPVIKGASEKVDILPKDMSDKQYKKMRDKQRATR